MKNLIFFLCLFSFSANITSSQNAETKIKVYLLGTFHFGDTDTTIFDIKTKSNQLEVQRLCSKIESFAPDKVFIERMPDFEYMNNMDSFYRAYQNGDTLRRRNEIWQIGFRVASHLHHNKIYQSDHPGNYGNIYAELEAYATEHDQLNILDYTAKGTTKPMYYDFDNDSLFSHSGLIQIMQLLNSTEYQSRSHAAYINTFPQIGNTDVYHYDANYLIGTELTADWYRRNIYIYSKMINQLDYTEKAIFLIIGNDHVPIIRHLFESNPYFEVVNTEEWLKKL